MCGGSRTGRERHVQRGEERGNSEKDDALGIGGGEKREEEGGKRMDAAKKAGWQVEREESEMVGKGVKAARKAGESGEKRQKREDRVCEEVTERVGGSKCKDEAERRGK